MSDLDSYQVMQPDLLSEDALREILENRCIEVPTVKAMSKNEMIEIFKRIALPMPQRQYNSERPLGRKMINLRSKRGIALVTYEETNIELDAITGNLPEPVRQRNGRHDKAQTISRLKPPIESVKLEFKKIRLSGTSRAETSSHKVAKRKTEDEKEAPPSTETKKRQKITWP